ncbi:MAG: glycosyltransferase family 4 protein [Phycisphaerales bacterium]|nr:glycosyltransferase family 4 protein [Phycisphaerales bacterium]
MRVLAYQVEQITLFDDPSDVTHEYTIAQPTDAERAAITFTAKRTTLSMWRRKFSLMRRLARQAKREGHDLVLVETHEEGFAAALAFRLFGRRIKLGVLSLNLPRQHAGWKGALVRWAFRRIDLAFVHSRADLTELLGKLGLTDRQMAFRRYWRFEPTHDQLDACKADEIDGPYVLAYGATDRDFDTFFKAMGGLPHQGVAVVRPWAVEGLTPPDNVIVHEHLPLAQLDGLIAGADLCVIPLLGELPSSGQIALLSAYRQGKATICTDVRGIIDYLEDGAVKRVPKRDVPAMRAAIDMLMSDEAARDALGRRAREVSETVFSAHAALREIDEAITQRFGGSA